MATIMTFLQFSFVFVTVQSGKSASTKELSSKSVTDTEKTSASQLSESTIQHMYPGFFRNASEQNTLAAALRKARPKTWEDTHDGSSHCQFSCSKSVRRTRSYILQGCCVTKITFPSPDTMENVNGVRRTILQYPSYKQFFQDYHCTQISNCGGCTCQQDSLVVTAVVVKEGIDVPLSISDTEIDFFIVPGCCRCLRY